VDGCLVEFQRRPEDVKIPETLLVTLAALKVELDGALAIVSGRTLEQLDHLFEPLQLPCAGLYGFERRGADGRKHPAPLPDREIVERVHREVYALLPRLPGLMIEDKGYSLALHYRTAPHLAGAVAEAAAAIVAPLPGAYEVQPGAMVQEVKPTTCDKGSAIRAFLHEPPFIGRAPVFLGDDHADEAAFAAVNALGGMSIGVGIARETRANFHLHDPAAARAWLADVQRVLAGGLRG
jgi:trehalose 6-phosphate phosphatase